MDVLGDGGGRHLRSATRMTDTRYELKPAQRRGLDLSTPARMLCFELDEPDEDNFGRAVVAVARRHDALRIRVTRSDGRTKQRFAAEPMVTRRVVDVRGGDANKRRDYVIRVTRALLGRRWSIEHDPGVHVEVLRFADGTAVMFVLLHPLVCDAGSLGVVQRDLLMAYTSGTVASEPAPSYEEWIAGASDVNPVDTEWVVSRIRNTQVAGPPVAQGDYATSAMPCRASVRVAERAADGRFRLAARATAAVAAATGAWSPFGSRLLLSTVNGRPPRWAGCVGAFTSATCFRVSLDSDQPGKSLLRSVRSETLEAYTHLNYDYQTMADALAMRIRSSRQAPLTVTVLPRQPAPQLPPGVRSVELTRRTRRPSVSILVEDAGDIIDTSVVWNPLVTPAFDGEGFLGAWSRAFESFVADDSRRIGEVVAPRRKRA